MFHLRFLHNLLLKCQVSNLLTYFSRHHFEKCPNFDNVGTQDENKWTVNCYRLAPTLLHGNPSGIVLFFGSPKGRTEIFKNWVFGIFFQKRRTMTTVLLRSLFVAPSRATWTRDPPPCLRVRSPLILPRPLSGRKTDSRLSTADDIGWVILVLI